MLFAAAVQFVAAGVQPSLEIHASRRVTYLRESHNIGGLF